MELCSLFNSSRATFVMKSGSPLYVRFSDTKRKYYLGTHLFRKVKGVGWGGVGKTHTGFEIKRSYPCKQHFEDKWGCEDKGAPIGYTPSKPFSNVGTLVLRMNISSIYNAYMPSTCTLLALSFVLFFRVGLFCLFVCFYFVVLVAVLCVCVV